MHLCCSQEHMTCCNSSTRIVSASAAVAGPGWHLHVEVGILACWPGWQHQRGCCLHAHYTVIQPIKIFSCAAFDATCAIATVGSADLDVAGGFMAAAASGINRRHILPFSVVAAVASYALPPSSSMIRPMSCTASSSAQQPSA